jgi:hypothetical protein
MADPLSTSPRSQASAWLSTDCSSQCPPRASFAPSGRWCCCGLNLWLRQPWQSLRAGSAVRVGQRRREVQAAPWQDVDHPEALQPTQGLALTAVPALVSHRSR